jgi:hypothetical protein
MPRLLTLRRNLERLLTRNEVDDNFVNVASDFSGSVDPASLPGAYVLPYMRWADTGTGWLKRRNAANDGWVSEQRLLRKTVQPFDAAELPTVDSGPIYVKGQGMAEWDAATGAYRVQQSSVPVGSVAWWPLRTSIPAGSIPADGQTVSRATFPDLAAMVTSGKVPVVSEADWLADPLKRGSYTVGDGSTTIRLPDFNGQSSGAIGAVFQRGDGALSSGVNGLLQRDALQNITGLTRNLLGLPSSLDPGSGALQKQDIGSSGSGGTSASLQFVNVGFDASRSARTSTETRPLNVSGVWTVQAFGAVTNPGSVDAAQLASDYAALNAALQTLNGQLAFTILYPNGGTAAAPASVAVNSTYVVTPPAPFLGFNVICRAELLYTDGWTETGWYTDSAGGNRSAGTRAGQLSNGAIIVRTGVTDVWPTPNLGGTPTQGSLVTPNKCRVLVWRVKG